MLGHSKLSLRGLDESEPGPEQSSWQKIFAIPVVTLWLTCRHPANATDSGLCRLGKEWIRHSMVLSIDLFLAINVERVSAWSRQWLGNANSPRSCEYGEWQMVENSFYKISCFTDLQLSQGTALLQYYGNWWMLNGCSDCSSNIATSEPKEKTEISKLSICVSLLKCIVYSLRTERIHIQD